MKDNFSTRIKELRTSKELTQKELAETLNISTVSVSSYETGTKTPSLDMVKNIAQKCNVSIDWLCGLSDNMTLDNHITTYKELFRLFITVLDVRYQKEQPNSIIDVIDTEKMSVRIALHDDINFQTFFSKWRDISKLHNEGTVDDDLYQMWIAKQLSDYDYPINGLPAFAQDLPDKE